MTRILTVALVVVCCAFSVTTIPGVRSQPGFDARYDGGLQLLGYVLAAVLVLFTARRRSYQRDMWTLIGISVALRALGFVIFVPFVRTQVPQPYPSLADAAWLASSVLLLVSLTYRLRVRAVRMTNALALDALAGALTATALAFALLYGAMVDLNADTSPAATATNLAYPILDVAVLVVVMGLLAAVGWRPPLARGVLAMGIAVGALVDCVFLYQVSAGTYRPGSWLAAVSLAGVAAIAIASAIEDGPGRMPVRNAAPGLTLPVLATLLCIGVLVFAAFHTVPVAALGLAVVAIAVAMSRAVLTLAQDRAIAEQEIVAANEQMLLFQSLVETSGDFIAIAGLDGQVSYVNPAGRRLVGLPDDTDVTTTSIADFLTEQGLQASIEVEQPAVLARGHWEGESTLRHLRGGPPIPVAISSFLMTNPRTGKPFGLATVQRDISERLANIRALRRLADERQELLARLVEAQEDERARIAADVHDDSVQILAALELRLSMLRKKAEAIAPELVGAADTSLTTVREATVRLRELLFDLESPAQSTDLVTALESAAVHVFEGLDVAVDVLGDRRLVLPEPTRITAYRITKEALVNARKHAGARQVRVEVTRERDGVLVTVDDDGVGFDADEVEVRPGHLGLRSMRDRATVAGGWLVTGARPGRGTRVRLWLPERAGWAPVEPDGPARPADAAGR